MKKLTLILLSIVMIVALAACGDKKCDHAYDNACDVTCNECGEERTITHDWNDATCLTPKTCSICGATEGDSLGHTAEADDGNCTTEVKCTVCGDVTTPAGQHTPNADDGDCTTPIVCSVCKTITTPAKESHTGGTATCTEKAVCTVCSTAYGTVDANNHIDENTNHICDRECGKTDIGTHADSAEDNDHVCDYGCGVILEDHKGGDGTATCEHGKVCSVCGEYYGDTLEHNYTYTANDDTNTITAACVNSCGHSQTIELNAPENAIYNGNKIEATVTGADGITYSLTYNADPVGSGTYTAILLLGDKQVSLEFTIAKATPSVQNPTANTLTYNGTAQTLVTPGMVDFDEVTMLYKVNDGEWVTEIPKATNAGTYTVYFKVVGNDNVKDVDEVSFTVTIAKATPEYTAPTVLTATYGQTLANVTLPEGWSWKDATTSVGNAGTNTFTAIFIPTDTVNYVTIEAEVTLEVAKAEINIDDLVNPEFAANLVYNGTAQKLVTANGSVPGGTILYSLTYDGEYTSTIPVATEAGRYGVYWLIQGDENHEDILSPGWTQVIIAAKPGSDASVTLGEYDSVYSGTAKEPDIASVVVDGVTLTAGKDYDVSYENNVYVGTATVTITFKGNYTGTATATFEITGDPATEEFDGEWVEIMY